MIISISQPAYIPWLGYFSRIKKSDIHVVLNNVQIERNTKNSFTNRNKLRNKDNIFWLTVPLKSSKNGDPKINEVLIDSSKKWQKKHYSSFNNYSKSKYYKQHKDWLENFYSKKWDLLCPMLDYSTKYLLEYLEIKTKIVYSSDLNIEGKKSEFIKNICLELKANSYLSGPLGKSYLDLGLFKDANIQVKFDEYNHPQYKQLFENFYPNLSIFDLILNHGKESVNFI
jgi:hypothetical protein